MTFDDIFDLVEGRIVGSDQRDSVCLFLGFVW